MKINHDNLSIEQIRDKLDEELDNITKRDTKLKKQKKINKQTKRIMKK